MKFRADEDGFITALRFYKQPNNTGTHVGHLWSGTGQLLAVAPFTNETPSGWQQVELPNPVAITKDTTYVASYYAASGRYGFSQGFFTQGVDRSPMHAPRDGLFGGNGVYRYGASAFPDQSFNATNYWVDAALRPDDPAGHARADGHRRRRPSPAPRTSRAATAVSATFDEQLAPAHGHGLQLHAARRGRQRGGGRRQLRRADAGSRSSRPDRRSPTARDYTARLKGGSGGVTDAAGNPLAADKVWSFTVAGQSPAEGPGGPIQIITDPGDPFGRYYAEILRGEGLNEFDATDGPVTADEARRPQRGPAGLAVGHRRRGGPAHQLGAGRRQPDRDAARTRSSPACSASATPAARAPTST